MTITKQSLIEKISKHPEDGAYFLDCLMIAKYFERIADHAVNIVEAAEEMQREQERRTIQAGISYIKYIEAVRERQYGIMPVYTPLFEKEGA